MEKITYILGAGASAEALPIIRRTNHEQDQKKTFSGSLIEFINRCENNFETSFQDAHVDQFRKDIRWLATECVEFSTPDTFGKYLYHKDRVALQKFKAALIGFFVIEQVFFQKRDKRSNVFITSLIEDSGQLPVNVGFISWNYDYQMQYAFNKYQEEEIGTQGGLNLHKPPLADYFPCQGYPHNYILPYKLVQLNGIAGFHYDHLLNMNLNLNSHPNSTRDFSQVIQQIYNKAKTGEMLFTFAWEKLGNSNSGNVLYQRMTHALKIAEDTTILVVIGYSFPFFNRKVDNEIFKKLLESGKLKKIYFQDPNIDGQFLKSQFDLPDIMNGIINPIQIFHINDVNNYYIPYEL